MKSAQYLILFLIVFSQQLGANAKTQTIDRLNEVIKVSIGDTVTYSPIQLSITLKSFKKHQSECAVPGFNCGAGYIPGVQHLPIIETSIDKKCEVGPVPSDCEVTYKIVETDNKTYLKIKFIDLFEPCNANTNISNKNSCLLLAIKNGPYKPPYHPKNCERITTPLESRDRCYEAIADELQDPAICNMIKGIQGFQCVLLRAKAAKDPNICKTLQRSALQRNERDHKNQVDACINSISVPN